MGTECEESVIHWAETDVLSMQELREESKKDSVLSSIMKRISHGRECIWIMGISRMWDCF